MSATKRDLRRRLADARRTRPAAERELAGPAWADQVLAFPELDGAVRVAAYLSRADEPDTMPLICALRERRIAVIVPVLRDDLDLDWVDDRGKVEPNRFGIGEPRGPLLGPDAVCAVDLIVCPALAADRSGHRLGRGGGSYDRVLARLEGGVPACVLLYDDEVLDEVPAEPHDQPVDRIVTPTAVIVV